MWDNHNPPAGRDLTEQFLNHDRAKIFQELLKFPSDDKCTPQELNRKRVLEHQYNELGRERRRYTRQMFGG